VASTPFAAGPSGAVRDDCERRRNARMNAAAMSTAIPGETHASMLNPDRGGAISARSPYVETNASMISCAL
jgi:hypothetical protein